MKKCNTPHCEPCEQMFENEMEELVDAVEGYTETEHRQRTEEVEEAFAGSDEGQAKDKE